MKAVLVICEGLHEIIFVQRSLGALTGCNWFDKPIGELPSPFGGMPPRSSKGLIARRIERDVDALTLRRAAYPPLPQFEAAVVDEDSQTIYVLIRANGKHQAAAVVRLFRDLDVALGVGPVDISGYAAALLLDANDEGLSATLAAFRDDYQEHFGDLSAADHAAWLEAPTCHVGVFVIHRSPSDPTGTLEDHLAPLAAAAWPGHFGEAEAFIDEGGQADDPASGSEANRLKAIITSAGQFQHPGAPLSTMVARDGIPTAQFEACKLSGELVRFLQAVPWTPPDGETSPPRTE